MALFSGINYLAVLAGVVFAVALGMVWYAPKTFYNVWLKEIGVDPEKLDRKSPRAMMAMPVMLVSVICEMLSLAIIIKMSGGGIMNAMTVGVLYCVFMSGIINLADTFFAQQSTKSWLISDGYKIIKVLVACVVIGFWK